MRIRFANDFPAELQVPVEKLINEYGPYYTRTVDHLTVYFGDDEQVDASIGVLTRYRSAGIFLTAKFACMDQEAREETINHELAHIPLDPLFAVIDTLLKHTQNEQARHITQEWLVNAIESATEDTARSVIELHRAKKAAASKAKRAKKVKKNGAPTGLPAPDTGDGRPDHHAGSDGDDRNASRRARPRQRRS